MHNERAEHDNIISFPEKETKKTNSNKYTILICIFVLLIVFVLIFFKDSSFKSTKQVNVKTISLSEANNFNYTDYLDGYIIAKDGKVYCYNTNQELQWELNGSKTSPTIKTNHRYCLIYYNDDKLAIITNGKKTKYIKTEGDVSYGYVNQNGYSVLFTKESGLKNKISVFNNKGEEIYFRQNADTHIPWAMLSDDNYTLLTLELSGTQKNISSVIRTYDTRKSDNQIAEINLNNEPIGGCFFYNKNSFVVVKNETMESYSVKGKKIWSVQYSNNKLSKFSYDNNLICLLFNNDGSANSGSEILFYKTNGSKCGKFSSDQHIYDVDLNNKSAVLRLDRHFLTLNSKGKLISSTDVSFDIKDSVMMSTKKCIFVLTTSNDAVLVEI